MPVVTPRAGRLLRQTTLPLTNQQRRLLSTGDTRDPGQEWWQGRVDGYKGWEGRGRAEEVRKYGSGPA